MRNVFKLLFTAIIAVALFASCEDQMDEIVVKEDAAVENIDKEGYMPPKSKLKVPPGY